VPDDVMALFRDGAVPLFLVDAEGALLFASRAASGLLGPGDLTQTPVWADVRTVASQALRLRSVNERCCARSRELLVGADVLRLIGRAIVLSSGPSPAAAAVVVERIDGPARRAVIERVRGLLTESELELVRLLARGCSRPEIATRLGVPAHGLRRRGERLLKRIGARTPADARALFSDG
jgi:DNA-binding CsgD family transcriptional regulator